MEDISAGDATYSIHYFMLCRMKKQLLKCGKGQREKYSLHKTPVYVAYPHGMQGLMSAADDRYFGHFDTNGAAVAMRRSR